VRALALAGLLALAACASIETNPPLARFEPAQGYRLDALAQAGEADGLFVIVTFSGGGTRAAALAYGVLEALRDTRVTWHGRRVALLDEVDVISSVSGGSFPAAYYALRGPQLFEEFPDRFLYRDLQGELVSQALAPWNWPKLLAGDYGRSDLAAEIYDREVFGGARYADLIAKRRRPFVILNATDLSSGQPFPFIQDQFDLLCSDLAGVSLARAAAASAAFPGGLTALTFRNYAGRCGYRQPAWVALAAADHASRANPRRTARAEYRLSLAAAGPARPYVHLIDGGVADNIGLREPLEAIASADHPWSVLRRMNLHAVADLVVIAVNAATAEPDGRDASSTVPGLVDTLTRAATAPLDNYSFDTVELLRRTVDDFNGDARVVAGCNRLSAAKGAQCALRLPALFSVGFFPVQVAFQYERDPAERAWLAKQPTTLSLPRASVDRLRAAGRRLLAEDPQFRRLLEALDGCLAPAAGAC
jgi:NTE family protein